MQLTKSDIYSILGVIKANYSYAYKDATKDTMLLLVDTWFQSLKEYPKEVVGQAVQLALEVYKTPPSLADIHEQINKMQEIVEPSINDLWAELYKTLSRISGLSTMLRNNLIEDNGKTQGANARDKINEIYSNLSPILQGYVCNVSMLIVLSHKTDEELNYEKNMFYKLVPQLKEKLRLKSKITIDTKLLLDDRTEKHALSNAIDNIQPQIYTHEISKENR